MTQPNRIRVASLQYWIRPVRTFVEFAEQVTDWVRSASDYKAQLVLFPEYFTLQLMSLESSALTSADLVRSVAKYKEQYCDLFSKLAALHHITIVAGTIPSFEPSNNLVFNESHVFSSSGATGVQEKIHMTRFEKEDFLISSHREPKLRIFETSWGRFAVAVCYDVEFPELIRAAALQGVHMVLVPSCTDDRQGYCRVRYCAQARTIENQIFVVQASTVGGLSRFPAASLNYGQAALLTPSDYSFSRDGILSEGTPNQETMVVGDFDLNLLAESRVNGTVLPLRDNQDSGDLMKKVEFVKL